MIFTRRQVIRDMTFASTAAVLNPPNDRQAKTQRAPLGWGTSGTRIVFGGAWIFCAHPTDKAGYMCAVSVNMPGKPHHFPYGPWNETSLSQWKDDTKITELPSGSTIATVKVQQQGKPWQPTIDLYTLFQQTHNNGPFTEIKGNGGTPYRIKDWGDPNLRVIELPIPSKILPTAIRLDATLSCNGTYCKPNQIDGLAFTNIFVYDRADIMSFSPLGSVFVSGSAAPESDLLILTIPGKHYGTGHATEMFNAMLKTVDSTLAKNVTLTVPEMKTAPGPGPAIPSAISADEQGNVMELPFHGDFATCGAVAAALGS